MAAWAPWLTAAALLLMVATAVLAGSLRTALFRLGVAAAGAGALVAALVGVGGAWLITRTPSLDADAVEALWSALLGDLRSAGLAVARSEEHTSELQSRQYLVCRLLLEKKKI